MVDKNIFGVNISSAGLVFLNIIVIIADNITEVTKNEITAARESSKELSTELNTELRHYRRENPAEIADMDISEIKTYFDQFNDFFKISYQNQKLKNKYYKTFEENVKRYLIMNKFTTSAKFRINEFSHLSLSEFSDWYTGFNDTYDDDKYVKDFKKIEIFKKVENSKNSTKHVDATRDSKHSKGSKTLRKSKKSTTTTTTVGPTTTKAIPTSLDLRILGLPNSLKNQGLCKMSYVSSAIANIEAQFAKDFKRHFKLSHIQGFGCEPKGGCKYGGMPHHVLEGIKKAGGAILEQDYHIRKSLRNQKICYANESSIKVQINDVLRMSVDGEDNLLQAFMEFGPLITAIHVSESVKNYHSGILAPTDCDAKPNHAVLLVGYGTSRTTNVPYWIIQNSWGKRWGENGYMRLLRGERACNIGSYVATSVVGRYVKPTTTTTTTTTRTTTKTTTTTTTNIVPKIFQLPRHKKTKANKTLAMGNHAKQPNINSTLSKRKGKTRGGRHKKNKTTQEKIHIVNSRQNVTAKLPAKSHNNNGTARKNHKAPRVPKIVFLDSSDDGKKGVQKARLEESSAEDTSNEPSDSWESEILVTRGLNSDRHIQRYYS